MNQFEHVKCQDRVPVQTIPSFYRAMKTEEMNILHQPMNLKYFVNENTSLYRFIKTYYQLILYQLPTTIFIQSFKTNLAAKLFFKKEILTKFD